MPDPSAGVFETLLVRDGRVQALNRHLARLGASLRELYGLALPAGARTAVCERAAALHGGHRLRVDAIPEGAGLRIAIATTALDPSRARQFTCTAVIVAGGHGQHKWRDRRALEDGPGVPLLVDEDESVLEAAWANFWLLDGRRLVTPPADGRLLPGVTRARLLELAPSLGLECSVRRISLDEARSAPSALLTSSLALAAAASVDRKPAPDSGLVETIRFALERGDWDDCAPC